MPSHVPSRNAKWLANPIVNDGNTMWNEIINANCSQDSKTASRSIA